MKERKKGILMVVSGPAGSGKGTVIKILREKDPGIALSVSATTRSPRPGEVDGVQYFFITREDGGRLMKWKSTQKKVVWELIFVFAGGLAAGALISKSGAADAIERFVAGTSMTGGFGTILLIVTLTVVLSDITSNTATAAVAIPIVIGIMQGLGKNPIPYVYIASIGVNLSYVLPTSIRAIPVGYGLEPRYMLKKGLPITVVVILTMSLMGYVMLEYWPAFSTI